MRARKLAALPFLGAALCGCHMMHDHASKWEDVDHAVAAIHPTPGNQVRGEVRFVEADGGVRVIADLEGLPPNSTHAFHIHELGDCTAPDGTRAGGHYNPAEHPHGLPEQEERHAGDLGNLASDAQGRAHKELTVHNITIAGLENPIVGRAVIVHAQPDTGEQPTGGAGARIGCGVIGIAKGEGM